MMPLDWLITGLLWVWLAETLVMAAVGLVAFAQKLPDCGSGHSRTCLSAVSGDPSCAPGVLPAGSVRWRASPSSASGAR